MDRNIKVNKTQRAASVALRKESVDRNTNIIDSSRAANVALRKESVDRNILLLVLISRKIGSLSARRAWIEIRHTSCDFPAPKCRSPQGERG